jgi:hypothetical protein
MIRLGIAIECREPAQRKPEFLQLGYLSAFYLMEDLLALSICAQQSLLRNPDPFDWLIIMETARC